MARAEATTQGARPAVTAQPGNMRTSDSSIQPHNERPAAVWSSGGEAYEAISRQIGTALEHCVARLDPRPGERILDLATGTGWTSRLVARRGADVTGADIAGDLLAAATDRARKEGLAIEYRIADAERLPFSDQSFDGVVSTFGVMFASRPEAAAAELARVCKRGGRIVLATWLPDSSVFKMFLVMRQFMPPPPSPAPPSPFEWGSRDRVRALLSDEFDVHFEEGVATYFDRDGASAWEAFVTGYGPTKALARGLDDNRRLELKQAFIAFHDGYRTELGISVPRQYLITLGKRQ
jgi:SAM-dependent methyltransferase